MGEAMFKFLKVCLWVLSVLLLSVEVSAQPGKRVDSLVTKVETKRVDEVFNYAIDAAEGKVESADGSDEGTVANYATTNDPDQFTGDNEAAAASAASNAYNNKYIRTNRSVGNSR